LALQKQKAIVEAKNFQTPRADIEAIWNGLMLAE